MARRITQKYDGFVLVSMGDLLRKSVSESPDDELWKRINTKIMEGEPVPTVVSHLDCNSNYLRNYVANSCTMKFTLSDKEPGAT